MRHVADNKNQARAYAVGKRGGDDGRQDPFQTVIRRLFQFALPVFGSERLALAINKVQHPLRAVFLAGRETRGKPHALIAVELIKVALLQRKFIDKGLSFQ